MLINRSFEVCALTDLSLALSVAHLLLILGVSISFFLNLGLSFLDFLHMLDLLLLLILGIYFAYLSKTLDHGMDLLLLFVHEHFLEGALGGQLQGLEEIGLAT